MSSITPIALHLENFGSFKKRQTFPFPRAPGLYFMQGKNESEPRMTGNGTGKSTVWNGLTWLLYDKTPDGLRAADVCNWDVDKGADVRMEFRRGDDGMSEFLIRTWKPNTWTCQDLFGNKVDLAKDPQNPVLADLRIAFEPFLSSVLMAQGRDMFLDMGKDKQAALFATVMDLDGWKERSERASKAASEQDRTSRDLERELAEARGRLDALEGQDHAGDARRWEAERDRRLARLEKDHEDLITREKVLRKALDGATGREEAARRGLAGAQVNQALEDERDLVAQNVRKQEDGRLRVKVQEDALNDRLAELNSGAKDCPVCKKPFDTKHWQEEVKRIERQLQGAKAELSGIEHTLQIARNRLNVLDDQLEHEEGKRRDVQRAVEDATREVSRARSDLALCSRQIDGLEEAYVNAERERNPHGDAAERIRVQVEGLRDQVHDLRAAADESAWTHSIKSMWVRGFKEIRLREIASALSELEVEVNSCVTALGLSDWELQFRVDRETKDGGVQRGFSVFVRAPGAGERPVPWEAWSGGEKQRLRVAGNMGLGNLVRARTGCGLPLEVWDEPTNGLSPEGKVDLFTALASRARDENRVVFLVDHQAHDFGGFAGTCTVIKTPSGSRVRASWAPAV